MQQAAMEMLKKFRSGTYYDRWVRSIMYTWFGLTSTYFWAWSSESGFWSHIALPLAQRLEVDEEWLLRRSVSWLSRCRGPFDTSSDHPNLGVSCFGRQLNNPLCIAAGFDRDGEAVNGLIRLGFSGVEVGTVVPLKQGGAPLPRITRLCDADTVLHHCDRPSRGLAVVSFFLDELRSWEARINYPANRNLVGVNVGANSTTAVADFAKDARVGVRVMSEAADYICVQLPSPPRPGARAFPSRQWLDGVARECAAQRASLPADARRPLLFKVPLDLTEEDRRDIAHVALARELDGLVVSGCAITPETADLPSSEVSGRPIKDKSTELLRDLYRRTQGQITLVGGGGVFTGQDALEKLEAGATLVQLYSALFIRGPGVVPQIKRDLARLLLERGYRDAGDAVGAGARRA
eukprot:TRINITY_DN65920_c0_g1_i1.p1 TRINITY_DN65920_c0_g1~~TRINITY_DN65920_c0_g1_i1.p1  ORF type:complete len:438 (+),score=109.07 TRINITY_DN65920_c0_g1_i1:94-1314(+)